MSRVAVLGAGAWGTALADLLDSLTSRSAIQPSQIAGLSFPIPNSINEYFFFVELDGHGQEPNVAQAIASLQSIAIRLSILGSYPKGT